MLVLIIIIIVDISCIVTYRIRRRAIRDLHRYHYYHYYKHHYYYYHDQYHCHQYNYQTPCDGMHALLIITTPTTTTTYTAGMFSWCRRYSPKRHHRPLCFFHKLVLLSLCDG